jgi:hypothetical protein
MEKSAQPQLGMEIWMQLESAAGGWSKIPIWIMEIRTVQIFLGTYGYSCRQRWTRRDSTQIQNNGAGNAYVSNFHYCDFGYSIAVSRRNGCCESDLLYHMYDGYGIDMLIVSIVSPSRV